MWRRACSFGHALSFAGHDVVAQSHDESGYAFLDPSHSRIVMSTTNSSNPSDSPHPPSPGDSQPEGETSAGYEVVGGVGKDSVLAGFDSDKDFDKDIAAADRPADASKRKESNARSGSGRTAPAEASDVADVDDVASMPVDGMPMPLIKPAHRSGLDSPRVLWGAGGVIVLLAMIASGWTAKSQNLAVAFLAGYQAILHTITGVVALVIISLLHGRPVGSYEQGAARLFVAIGAFQLVMGLEFGLFEGKAEEFAAASVVYALAMMALFRLRFKVILEIVAVHLLIIGVMWLGTQLAIAAVPTVKR